MEAPLTFYKFQELINKYETIILLSPMAQVGAGIIIKTETQKNGFNGSATVFLLSLRR